MTWKSRKHKRVPNKMDAKRPTPRNIIIKMLKVKDKERLLKVAREKQLVTYRVVPISLSADFSKQILQARRGWQEISKVMKSREVQPSYYSTQPSYHLESKGRKRAFKTKKTRVHHHQTIRI